MLLKINHLVSLTNLKINQIKELKQTKAFLWISFIITFLLAIRPIPWATDDVNYLDYLSYSGESLVSLFKNPLRLLVDEPLWLLFNTILGLFLNAEIAVRVIIIISCIIALKSIGKLTNNSILMLFLFVFIGEVLAKYILHLRQGLAISIFLLGLAIGGNKGTFIKGLAPFIHTSFWIVILYDIFEMLLKRQKISVRKRLTIFSVMNMIVILLIPYLTVLLNDRRVDIYNFSMSPDASGNGFIFWLIFGLTYLLVIEKDHFGILGCYGIIFYLESYFILEFSPRILENFLLIIIIAIVNSKQRYSNVPLILLLIFGFLGWFFRGGFTF